MRNPSESSNVAAERATDLDRLGACPPTTGPASWLYDDLDKKDEAMKWRKELEARKKESGVRN
jgi:hypothetical protein